MGWTWRAGSNVMLTRYPQLANIPELVEKWPALKAEVTKLEAGNFKKLELPEKGKGLPLSGQNDTTE